MPRLCICIGLMVLTLLFPLNNAAHHEMPDLTGNLGNFFEPVTPDDDGPQISEATEPQEDFVEPSVSEDSNLDEGNDSVNRIIIGLRDEDETGNKDVEIDSGENKPDMTFEGNESLVDDDEIDLMDLGLDMHMEMPHEEKVANVQHDRQVEHIGQVSFHDLGHEEPVLDKQIEIPMPHFNHRPVNVIHKKLIHVIYKEPVPQKKPGRYVPTINHETYTSEPSISFVPQLWVHKRVPRLVSGMMGHGAKYGNTYSRKHVNGKNRYSLPNYGEDHYSTSKPAKGHWEHAHGKDNYSSHGYKKEAKATYGKDNSKLGYDIKSYSRPGHEKHNYSKSVHSNYHSKHAANYDSRSGHGKGKYAKKHAKSAQANYYSNFL